MYNSFPFEEALQTIKIRAMAHHAGQFTTAAMDPDKVNVLDLIPSSRPHSLQPSRTS